MLKELIVPKSFYKQNYAHLVLLHSEQILKTRFTVWKVFLKLYLALFRLFTLHNRTCTHSLRNYINVPWSFPAVVFCISQPHLPCWTFFDKLNQEYNHENTVLIVLKYLEVVSWRKMSHLQVESIDRTWQLIPKTEENTLNKCWNFININLIQNLKLYLKTILFAHIPLKYF